MSALHVAGMAVQRPRASEGPQAASSSSPSAFGCRTRPEPPPFQLEVVRQEVISCAAGLGHFKKWLSRLPSRSPRWRCAFFRFPAPELLFVDVVGLPVVESALLQPLVQQRLSLHHVFEAQLESLEPANGGLRGENISVKSSQR